MAKCYGLLIADECFSLFLGSCWSKVLGVGRNVLTVGRDFDKAGIMPQKWLKRFKVDDVLFTKHLEKPLKT